jgi:hypothetical protein
MDNKEFVWTDELVIDVMQYRYKCDETRESILHDLNHFKTTKQPKPEWEIVAVDGRNGTGIYRRTGDKWVNDCGWNAFAHDNFDAEMRTGFAGIHSIKRLSDGEVFTVGDIVSWGTFRYNTPIAGFKAQTGVEKVLVCFRNSLDVCLDYLRHAKEEPQPVCLTASQIEKLHKVLNKE